MSSELLLATFFSGISMGSIYALFALGLSLIYGVTKVFNFALGSFMLCCCYYTWFALNHLHMNYGLSIIIGLLGAALLGVIMEAGIMHPLRRKSNWQFYTMVATLAFGIFLDNVNLVSFGALSKSFPQLMEGSITIGNTFLMSGQDALNFTVAVSLLVFLQIFLRKAKIGMALRAVSQNAKGAECVGINADRMFLYVCVISSVLAGIAGLLLAQKYYISPMGGWEPLIKGFVIVAFGGVGSSKGVLYGAFILAFVESIVTLLWGPFWVLFFWFLVLLLILLLKPQGLFGLKE